MEIEFTVPGEPKAKQRPRFANVGGYTRTYTPKQTQLYENLVRLEYERATDGYRYADDAMLLMRIEAYYSIPKSTSKAKRLKMLYKIIRPTKKPDVDNLTKIIADSLNGIAYRDDSQIVDCSCKKFYGEKPLVKVYIADMSEG